MASHVRLQVAELVHRMLAKVPLRRPQSPTELVAELVRWRSRRSARGRPEVLERHYFERFGIEYLAAGAKLVSIFDPIRVAAVVYQAGHPPKLLGLPDDLTAEAIIPGFRLNVGDVLGFEHSDFKRGV